MKKISTLIAMASLAILGTGNSGYAQQGASLNFDGANDYVASNSPISHGNQFTYEAWIKTSSPNDWGGIMATSTTSGQTQWVQFTLTGGGRLKTEIVDNAGNNKWYEGTTTLVNDGNWHHTAITYDGNNNLVLYVDGISQALFKQNDGTLGAMTINSTLYVGSERSLGPKFNGSIDEARIWTVARSQAQIQASMNCSVSDTAAGLLTYYRFNDGKANVSNAGNTTLHDATFGKLDGTLMNFALTGSSSNFVTDYFMNYFSMQSTLTDANCANTLGGAVTADFNGDGSKDLIMIDWNGNTRMYANDGNGNFPVSYSNPITGGGVLEAADADNDGDYDLIVAGGATVTVYANNGSGTFAAVTGNFFQGTGGANVTKMADLNGDGKKDLIVGNGGSGATDSSLIYYNTGTTGNAAFTYKFGIAPNPGRNSIDVGDVNGDTYPDIITGGGSWGAQLLFNVNNGASFAMQTPPAGYSGGARFVDWNQDGKLDYVNYDQYNNYGLHYVLNDGTGHFNGTSTILLQDYNAHYAKLADLNGDGFLDAVIDNWGGNARAYLSNGCALTLQNSCNYSLGRADNNIALADYNGDGSIDIFCQARCNSSSVYMNYLTPVVGTPLPNVSITGNTTINYGASTVLTAHGASAYQWDGNAGSATTASVSVNPTVTTNYVVVGTNSVGCSSSATVQVSINGAALNFNGTNNTVDLGMGITNALVGGNQLTAEAWVAPTTSVSTGQTIVNNHQNTTQFLLGVNGSSYYFFIGFGAYGVTTPSGVVTPGAWQHVAGVYDGSSIKIYVDGVLQGTTAVTSPFTFPASATTTKLGSDAFGEYFDGSIDEVRIWNRALCLGELQNNMNGELHLPQSGLLGYYHLNEGVASGNNAGVTTAVDSSGNGNNGALQNFALNGNTSNWIAPGGVMSGSYVTAYAAPTLTVSGTTAICNGNSTVLTASGADTYTWTSGPSAAAYTVSPTSDATYTVNGTSLGCPANAAVVTVTVNPVPSVTSLSGNVNLCGDVSTTFSISSTGANTYQWIYESVAPLGFDSAAITGLYSETGYTTTAMTIAQPYTQNYDHYAVYCIVTNSLNCSSVSAPDTIYVNPLPTVAATVSSATLCIGFNDTLFATGALTYTWSSNAASTVNDTAIVSPTANDSYTVTGTDNNGCMNTATVSIVVNNCGSGIDQSSKGGWVVYPNPSNGNFTLRSDSEIGSVEIHNALGELVYKTIATGTSLEINLTNNAAGVYYLHAQGKKMMLSKQ